VEANYRLAGRNHRLARANDRGAGRNIFIGRLRASQNERRRTASSAGAKKWAALSEMHKSIARRRRGSLNADADEQGRRCVRERGRPTFDEQRKRI